MFATVSSASDLLYGNASNGNGAFIVPTNKPLDLPGNKTLFKDQTLLKDISAAQKPLGVEEALQRMPNLAALLLRETGKDSQVGVLLGVLLGPPLYA